MTDNLTTEALLQKLKVMVTDARPVPMSASCLVNRADTLALLERALAALPGEIDQARGLIAHCAEDAERIRGDALTAAQRLASESEVAQRAREHADRLVAEASAECDALRAETDGYVDTRMAEFEAALAKTTSQVRTVRARLAERLPKPAEDDAGPLPTL